jgi:Mannosyltransferase (PIG-V)
MAHVFAERNVSRNSLSGRLSRAVVVIVDTIIAAYGLALIVSVFSAGLDLGFVSISNAAKPLLVLALVIPVRLVLPGSPWFGRMPGWPAQWGHRLWSWGRIRVGNSPALSDVSFALLVTHTFAFGVAFLANLLLVPARARGFALPFDSQKFAEIFAAWDSGWYFDIAQRGYYYRPDGESSIAFFPLYPMLIRAVAWPFGSTERAIWGAGIFVSCATFALALLALHDLARKLAGDRAIARRTVLYVAVFPFSLFFTRVYAESLFLLTSVLAISRAYDGRWSHAGVWGAAATLARPNGILVAIPLVLLAIGQLRLAPATLRARFAWLLLPPFAFAGYCAFVYTLSGDPLAWLSAQSHWAYSLGHAPWQQLLKMVDRLVEHGLYGYFFVTPMAPFRLLHGIAAFAFLALTPAVFRRFGAPLGSYVLVSLLVPLSASALEGVGRYASVLFPVFILAASWPSPRLHEAILIGGALLLALLNCLFVTLHPIY